jgi:acetolactate synthase-1/2/3 large subunit
MEGDGSIMLNLQELQTVLYHQLPLKIFIFNNNGYYSIRNTHLKYFNKIFAADPNSGVSLPNFEKLITGWGLNYQRIANNNELAKVKEIIKFQGPIVCELMIDPYQPMLSHWEAGLLREKS